MDFRKTPRDLDDFQPIYNPENCCELTKKERKRYTHQPYNNKLITLLKYLKFLPSYNFYHYFSLFKKKLLELT